MDFLQEIVSVSWGVGVYVILSVTALSRYFTSDNDPPCPPISVPGFKILDSQVTCGKSKIPPSTTDSHLYVMWNSCAPEPTRADYENPLIFLGGGDYIYYSQQFARTYWRGGGMSISLTSIPGWEGTNGWFSTREQAQAYTNAFIDTMTDRYTDPEGGDSAVYYAVYEPDGSISPSQPSTPIGTIANNYVLDLVIDSVTTPGSSDALATAKYLVFIPSGQATIPVVCNTQGDYQFSYIDAEVYKASGVTADGSVTIDSIEDRLAPDNGATDSVAGTPAVFTVTLMKGTQISISDNGSGGQTGGVG